jgi:hypothetical protein
MIEIKVMSKHQMDQALLKKFVRECMYGYHYKNIATTQDANIHVLPHVGFIEKRAPKVYAVHNKKYNGFKVQIWQGV